MNPYRTIYPGFWTGTTGKEIKSKGIECQLLAMYLMTNRHAHPTGLFYMPACFITHEIGLSVLKVKKNLKFLIDFEFCEYDPSSEWIWVINMAKYQIAPDLQPGDKRIKWVEKELVNVSKEAPELNAHFIKQYQKIYNLFLNIPAPWEPLQSPIEAPSKPLQSPIKDPPKPENREQRTENREQISENREQREENPARPKEIFSPGPSVSPSLLLKKKIGGPIGEVIEEIFQYAATSEDMPEIKTEKMILKAKGIISARLKEGYTAPLLKAHIGRYLERKRAHIWFRKRFGNDPELNSMLWCPNTRWRLPEILSPERLDKYFSVWKEEGSITETARLEASGKKIDTVGKWEGAETYPFRDETQEKTYATERKCEMLALSELAKEHLKGNTLRQGAPGG